MKIAYQIGDATLPTGDDPKIVVHVCNDAGGWGKGFVVALSRRWEEPEKRYRAWHRGESSQPFELGQVQFVRVEDSTWVANLIGQHRMGFCDGLPPIRYEAIREGLAAVGAKAKELGASVHMPRIGCGLAGGKWDEIERIITEELIANEVAVIVYDLAQHQQARQLSSPHRAATPGQIQTAIMVLEKLARRIDGTAASAVSRLPDTQWADKYAERLESETIQKTTAIQTVEAQLQNWHDELAQQQKTSMSYRV